jgi:hypothetical protein
MKAPLHRKAELNFTNHTDEPRRRFRELTKVSLEFKLTGNCARSQVSLTDWHGLALIKERLRCLDSVSLTFLSLS